MHRTASLLSLLLLSCSALAEPLYRVDSGGGPLSLFEDVAAAFQLWEEAGAPPGAAEDPAAVNLFRFADPAVMGPDLVSATLQRNGGPVQLEVVLQPELYRDQPAALLHESGLVLGLRTATEGVMQPALSQDAPQRPQEADVRQLGELATLVPGDLDGDGVVGFTDLLLLAASFGQRGVNQPADLDGDGVVGEADLVLLRELYGFTEPARPAAGDAAPDSAAPDSAAPDSAAPDPELPSVPEPAGGPGSPERSAEPPAGADQQ